MGASHLKRELAGVALILFALFLAAAVAFGQNADTLSACWSARGPVGPVGSCLKYAFTQLLGVPATLLVPLVPLVHALRLMGRMRSETDRSWLVFLGGFVLLLPIGIGLALGAQRVPSTLTGVWGGAMAFYITQALGLVGAWILVALALSALMVLTLAWNPVRVLIGWGERGVAAGATVATAATAVAVATVDDDRRAKRRARKNGDQSSLMAALEPAPEEMPAVDPTLMTASVADPPNESVDGGKKKREKKAKADIAAERVEKVSAEMNATAVAEIGDELPPVDLLTPPPPRNFDGGKRELDAMGVKLKEALATFRVEAEIVGRTTGPVVTQFEVEPAPGVKVRQIANLANDLALAMRAQSIRIVAPIPGRGAVGVEVPNPDSEIVAFRELLESREFQNARMALPIALGKDLEGQPIIADLAKMPHLLIAGATGSGKSVCINTLVTSLVYRNTPRKLRLLMVDPKMVELSVYNTLPHLRHKVITDNRDAAAVLKWAVLEMQERYELLAANVCRNIQEFNRRVQSGASLKYPKKADVGLAELPYSGGELPYIVVVIDELADLMMTVQGEIETPLAILAQKARAIGIHIILATQRPSVNVITGLIKANFPSRIAFRVASQVDSRTIIDGIGAESLLGNGDMLFIPPGKSEPWRLQGAFIASEDTERLMQWYADRREARRKAYEAKGLIAEEPTEAEADILEAVRQRELAEAAGVPADGEEPGERDKLFREAAEVVIQHQQGSTSLLQRRLKVGYGRAARIIDQLHEAGVLGPPDGSKPRDVLVGLDDLDRICGPRV
ncbi:MAG TPA: DNA translocase FtsK [Gemmatimonadaceae bacterium]|nr:DNA translocase FtsK [Gemmatimonadaceae bacterium]